jgi:hypothetical protein
MNTRSVLVLVAAVALGALAWRAGEWQGILVLFSGLMLWVMLHITRMLTVMKRAADRPLGYVGSAVMLNSKLRNGLTLLHVVGLTRSIGQRVSDENAQPEIFRWSDPGNSHVTAEFEDGRLRRWRLERPQEDLSAEALTPP